MGRILAGPAARRLGSRGRAGRATRERHLRILSSETTIPRRTSPPPHASRAESRSPSARAAKSAVKTGSRAKITAARTPEDLGLEVLRREIGISVAQVRGGLFLTSVARESPADRKGIERGDALLAVNGKRVSTLEDVARAIERGYGRSGVVLSVGRGGYAYHLTFALD